MNTTTSRPKKVARVAIDVRLFFDVPITSEKTDDIRQSAYAEFEKVEEGERIRINKLRHPNIYLMEEWSDLSRSDFQICQLCEVPDANSNTRFPL